MDESRGRQSESTDGSRRVDLNRSAFVRELLERLGETPETRDSLVEQAATRLARGDLTTNEATKQAAAAILASYGMPEGEAPA